MLIVLTVLGHFLAVANVDTKEVVLNANVSGQRRFNCSNTLCRVISSNELLPQSICLSNGTTFCDSHFQTFTTEMK